MTADTATEASAAPRRAPTLLRALLARILLPTLLIMSATAALALVTAQRLIDHTFDRWLLDAANSLAQQVRFVEGRALLDLGDDAQAIVAFDVVDRVYYAVEQGDHHVAGQTGLPQYGINDRRYGRDHVFDAELGGRRVRVAAVEVLAKGLTDASDARVLVAETVLKRQAVQEDLRLTMVPLSALLLAAAMSIVVALRWTLASLQPIARRWQAQSQASLQPVGLENVPRELQPFASTLNESLARIHDLLVRERRFAANAAHQIRTPLAGLQLGLSRAAQSPDLATTRQAIGELQQATQRTSRLLQQLLALGRLDPETAHDLEAHAVDLGTLAGEVGEAYLDAALARGITLELVAPPQPVTVRVQADLVSEALGNLVDNAIRYTPTGGQVLIEVLTSPARLVVSDNGPGIADDEREAVLERFSRGRSATGDGSGLGLAIVREIATLHRATLALSRADAGGLRAELRFADDAASGGTST